MTTQTQAKSVSNRLAVYRVLSRTTHGLTAAEIRKKIRMAPENGQLGVILRGEVAAGRILVSVRDVEGRDVTHYRLSANGRRALEGGTVDDDSRRLGLVRLGRTENSPS